MFKTYQYLVILLCLSLSNNALADCVSSPLVVNPVSTLNDQTACYPGSQEEHHSDGTLWDYKTGDTNHPVDPRKQIGTWSVSSSQVTYNYSDGTNTSGPFIFDLRTNGGASYSLCGVNVTDIQDVDLEPGFNGCSPAN